MVLLKVKEDFFSLKEKRAEKKMYFFSALSFLLTYFCSEVPKEYSCSEI